MTRDENRDSRLRRDGLGVRGAARVGAGHEVWAVDTWRDHVDAMRTKGLRLEGASGDRTVKRERDHDGVRCRRRAIS